MNKRIWIPLCLLFGAYHLSLLIDDYYLTNYLIVENEDSLYDDLTYFFFCSTFSQIKKNNQLKEIPVRLKNVTGKVFLNYSISSIEDNLRLKGNKLLKLDRSFSYNKRVCFLVAKSELETEWPFFREYLKYYNLELFASSRCAIEYNQNIRPNFFKVEKP